MSKKVRQVTGQYWQTNSGSGSPEDMRDQGFTDGLRRRPRYNGPSGTAAHLAYKEGYEEGLAHKPVTVRRVGGRPAVVKQGGKVSKQNKNARLRNRD